MGTLNEDLSAIKTVEDTLTSNKVARFAYTDLAYTNNDANGVAEYNVNNEQNIPVATANVMKVNDTVLSKGYRAQASSVTRMLLNHFLGRLSYNLNKVNDNMSNLLATLISHRGTANGLATLDADGRIPYSQLPESAVELKGYWNANTNTPTLADGTGDDGDEYYVDVAGSQDLGSGTQYFNIGDRVLYIDGVWKNINSTAVKSVNSVLPNAQGNVTILDNVVNTGDSDSPEEDGTEKFTTGGAFNLLQTIKEYSSNQDLLSNVETFTLTETNQQIQYDGFLLVHAKGSGTWGTSVYVNDVEASVSYATSTSTMTVTIPVAKGDNVRYAGTAPDRTKARFYKLRDYMGRQTTN